jgi:hypothetical protein
MLVHRKLEINVAVEFAGYTLGGVFPRFVFCRFKAPCQLSYTAKVQGNDTDLINVYTCCKYRECSVNDVDVTPRYLWSSFLLAHRCRSTKNDYLRSSHFLQNQDLI